MGIKFVPVGFKEAERELSGEGMDVMYECAEAGYKEAYAVAPEDQGELKDKLGAYRTNDGAILLSEADHSFLVEWGTGREAEAGAPRQPRRQTKWTYYSERFGFVSTYGHQAQPHMRPGFDEGLAQFQRSKKQRDL